MTTTASCALHVTGFNEQIQRPLMKKTKGVTTYELQGHVLYLFKLTRSPGYPIPKE